MAGEEFFWVPREQELVEASRLLESNNASIFCFGWDVNIHATRKEAISVALAQWESCTPKVRNLLFKFFQSIAKVFTRKDGSKSAFIYTRTRSLTPVGIKRTPIILTKLF